MVDENTEEGEVISLEDIDKILETEDPEFSEKMNEISKDEDLKSADVEVVTLETDTLEDKDQEPKKPKLFEKIPFAKKIIMPSWKFIKKYWQNFVVKKNNFTERIKKSINSIIHWLKNDIPSTLKKAGEKAKFYKSLWLANAIKVYKKFSGLSRKKKWAGFVAIILVAGTLHLVNLTLGDGWLPELGRPLVTSLENVGTDVIVFDSKDGLVNFYDAFPQPEFFVLLKKVVVSLKRQRSYKTPMAYGEFYLEVDAQETAIEIDDRMTQVLDVTQRALEGFTYPETQGAAGKAKMAASVRYEINKILNQGRVIRVFTKSFITKP